MARDHDEDDTQPSQPQRGPLGRQEIARMPCHAVCYPALFSSAKGTMQLFMCHPDSVGVTLCVMDCIWTLGQRVVLTDVQGQLQPQPYIFISLGAEKM